MSSRQQQNSGTSEVRDALRFDEDRLTRDLKTKKGLPFSLDDVVEDPLDRLEFCLGAIGFAVIGESVGVVDPFPCLH